MKYLVNKINIHPLFVVLAIIMVITGNSLPFFTYILVLLIHETTHAVVAAWFGYKLQNLTFMPQGAMLDASEQFKKPIHEVVVALSAPIVNILIAFIFIGIWWLIPESYILTEQFVHANIFIAVFNLLPILPLDGGRTLLAICSHHKKRKLGVILTTVFAIITSVVLLILFVLSFWGSINFTFIIMAIFLLSGQFLYEKRNAYFYDYKFNEIIKILEKRDLGKKIHS